MYQDILQQSWVYQEILQEGREEALRETLINCMETRFPMLVDLTKQRTDDIKNPDELQKIIVKMFTFQTPQEAEQYLLTLGNGAKH